MRRVERGKICVYTEWASNKMFKNDRRYAFSSFVQPSRRISIGEVRRMMISWQVFCKLSLWRVCIIKICLEGY